MGKVATATRVWALRIVEDGWKDAHSTVDYWDRTYSEGGRLTKKQMELIEAQLERSKNLPKYNVII